MTKATLSTRRKSLLPAILSAGLVAGLLDITGAILNHYLNGGNNPAGIFRFIASGLFGKEAFSGGTGMVLWGALFHFLIAIIFTAIFFVLYPKLKFLSRNTVVTGFLYGICVWLVMNLVVLPISNTPSYPFTVKGVIVGMIILVLAVGMPLSVLAYRHYSKK